MDSAGRLSARRPHRRCHAFPRRGARRGLDAQAARGDLAQGLFGWQDYALVDATVPGAVCSRQACADHAGAEHARAQRAHRVFRAARCRAPRGGRRWSSPPLPVRPDRSPDRSPDQAVSRDRRRAGGAEKCAWLMQEAGFTAAIDYKSQDVRARLGELCPKGIDVYFDNVGGQILDAVLATLRLSRSGWCSAAPWPAMTARSPRARSRTIPTSSSSGAGWRGLSSSTIRALR